MLHSNQFMPFGVILLAPAGVWIFVLNECRNKTYPFGLTYKHNSPHKQSVPNVAKQPKQAKINLVTL